MPVVLTGNKSSESIEEMLDKASWLSGRCAVRGFAFEPVEANHERPEPHENDGMEKIEV